MYNFIKRLPDGFHLVKQKPADKKRIEAEDIGLISHWFDMLEPIIRATSPQHGTQVLKLLSFLFLDDKILSRETLREHQKIINQLKKYTRKYHAEKTKHLGALVFQTLSEGMGAIRVPVRCPFDSVQTNSSRLYIYVFPFS